MYSPTQERIVARELARAGGNIRAAVKRLRTEYESFDKFGEATLRRMREKDSFLKVCEEEKKRIEMAAEEAAQAIEEKRARDEISTSRERDEDVLKSAQERMLLVIKDLKPQQLGIFYNNLLKTIEKRRQVSKLAPPAVSRKTAPTDQQTLDDL
jgi:hypothetical protein